MIIPDRFIQRLIKLVAAGLFLWYTGSQSLADETPQVRKTLTVTLADAETGKPLANIPTLVYVGDQESKPKSNSEGQITIEYDWPATRHLYIQARPAGHVPMSIRFAWRSKDFTIPDTVTIPFPKAITIGGTVVDEEGKPVAGASVGIWAVSSLEMVPVVSLACNEEDTAITDSEGRWRFTGVPADLSGVSFYTMYSHPDFISDSALGDTPQPPIEDLRAFTARSVMKKGLPLAGRVLDCYGKPISGATVGQGRDRFSSSPPPSATTNEQGEFRFPANTPGEVMLTVIAKGHAPDMKNIHLDKDTPHVEFKLPPAQTIKIRLVDNKGNPLPKVNAYPDTWRNFRTLGGEWLSESDENGEVVWDSAPADPVVYQFMGGGVGYQQATVSADQEVNIITLYKPATVSGTVTDGSTGNPIPSFRIIEGGVFDSGSRYIQRDMARDGKEGRYTMTYSSPDRGVFVRIEAPGYRATNSDVFYLQKPVTEFNIKLTPERGPAGMVLTPDGKPASGATLYLVTEMMQLWIDLSGEKEQAQAASTTTDEKGSFEFFSPDQPYAILASHESGFAIVDEERFRIDGRIKLQKWASIEGKLPTPDSSTAPGQVHLSSLFPNRDGMPRIGISGIITTSLDGSFKADRLPPLPFVVTPWTDYFDSENKPAERHIPLDLQPGQTSTVDLGGKGAVVVGRVVTTGKKLERFEYGSHYLRPIAPPVISLPWVTGGFDWKEPWNAVWEGTEEGRAYISTLQYDTFRLNSDGTFRIEGVAPGEYAIRLNIYDVPQEWCLVRPLGERTLRFTVGESDNTIDLCDVSIHLKPALAPGDPAPFFAFSTVNGETMDLESLRGKYILLDFWATWCGPCREQTPYLKETWEAFGSDERFAMISMSLDANPETPSKYATEHGLHWPQGFLGEWSRTDIPSRFGFQGIPAIYLIGHDGKIISAYLSDNKIKEAVAAALTKKK